MATLEPMESMEEMSAAATGVAAGTLAHVGEQDLTDTWAPGTLPELVHDDPGSDPYNRTGRFVRPKTRLAKTPGS
jgi:hypothetical protein